MAPNINDVAKSAGVSIATVSRYFNSPEVVSEDAKRRISEAITTLDYKPNALARGLITNETKSIGIIMQDINNIFYPAVIRGVEDYLEANGYSLFISNTDSNPNKEKRYINTYLERRVDGLIFLGTRPVDPVLNQSVYEVSKRIPVVVVSESMKTDDEDGILGCVYSKEEEGAYNAVKYLVDLGHRSIAFFTAESSISTYLKKKNGYQKALRDAGIAYDESIIFVDKPYAEGGYKAGMKFFSLEKEQRPTAIFSISDQMAQGIVKAAFESDCKIPEELSIIGFSGVPISADMYPALTTVDQEPYKMGKEGAKMLISFIKGDRIQSKDVALDTKLVIRNTCKNP